MSWPPSAILAHRGLETPSLLEVRDCKGERRIPVKTARNVRSREFAEAVGEMKVELLRRGRNRRGNRLN